MEKSERQTRSYLMRLFERHGIHPRWKLGQNFLIDLNIIEFIVREAELTCQDVVLEVGPGTGGMTTFMAREAGHVISVELDPNMYKLASEATAAYDNVTLLNQDALRSKNHLAENVLQLVQEQLSVDPRRQLKLVANLPYAVATPVMSNLLATDFPLARMVVTIQYELGLRMQAPPRHADYGALSVWMQSQCHVEILKKLGPTVFWPRPKVDSAVVKVLPDPQLRSRIADRTFFHDFIRRVFLHRRKLLRGVLTDMYRDQLPKAAIEQTLQQLGIPDSVRAEELEVATHIELANSLRELILSGRPLTHP